MQKTYYFTYLMFKNYKYPGPTTLPIETEILKEQQLF
jgi:hypothetical protein